jgi:hemoglobin
MRALTHSREEQLFLSGKAASAVVTSPVPFVKTARGKNIKVLAANLLAIRLQTCLFRRSYDIGQRHGSGAVGIIGYHKDMQLDHVIQAAREGITEESIAVLVNTFYSRVRQDETLGPVFERVIGGEWEPHLEKMRAFWSSLTLASGRYKGNPMMAHLMLMPRIGAEHFERWLELWRETTAELLPQQAAAKFVGKAETMAERLLATIDQYHGHLEQNQRYCVLSGCD